MHLSADASSPPGAATSGVGSAAVLPAPAATASATDPRRAGRAPVLLLAGLLAVLVRLPLLGAPPGTDESGYLLVVQHLHAGGPFSYGDVWVDRPPLLVALFRLCDALGGLPALRALGLLAGAALAVACADAGGTLAGRRGACWAGTVATVLPASPLLGGPEVNGELLGVPLVAVAVAVGLRTLTRSHWRPTARHLLQLAAAGALGAAAALVKQNLLDALVLLAALVLLRAPRRGLRATAAEGSALVVGAVLPIALAVGTSRWWGAGPRQLWTDVVAFRAEALHVLSRTSQAAPAAGHGRTLLLAALACGAGPLVLALPARVLLRRADPPAPEVSATLAMAAWGVLSLVLSAGGWLHYLVELVPATAVTAALLSRSGRPPRAAGVVALGLPVLSTLVATTVLLPDAAARDCRTQESGATVVSAWLARHARPSDSVVNLYGAANTLSGTRLRLPYPYLWSLPVRTLDPDLARLRPVLSGPSRVDWVVLTLPLHTWDLDADQHVEQALATGYRPAATLCGVRLLHRT